MYYDIISVQLVMEKAIIILLLPSSMNMTDIMLGE